MTRRNHRVTAMIWLGIYLACIVGVALAVVIIVGVAP